jgi:16S rRNA (guanine1516-N2)-methyltransferase
VAGIIMMDPVVPPGGSPLPDKAVVAAVAALEPGLLPRAEALAQMLSLACLGAVDASAWRALCSYPVLLLCTAEGLSLGLTGAGRVLPTRADFADPALLHRLRMGGPRSEDMARALGVHEKRGMRIVDATAGWGRDSAVLAGLGCDVTMIERHPVIAVLLEDALQRARASEDPAVLALAQRLRLVQADARATLQHWQGEAPDSVLIDPMFPERSNSAAVRKEMRLFHEIVGDDEDAPALLAAALAVAAHRVVVKRPRKAPPLAGPRPAYAISGRSTRFDVYTLRRF